MKVPVSWLKDYVDVTIPIEELANRLTLAGMEVLSDPTRGAAVTPRGQELEVHLVEGQEPLQIGGDPEERGLEGGMDV